MQSVYVNESSESHELRVLDVVRQVQAQAESVKEPSVEEIKVIVRVAALVLSRIDEHLDNDERVQAARHVPGILGLGVMLAAWTARKP